MNEYIPPKYTPPPPSLRSIYKKPCSIRGSSKKVVRFPTILELEKKIPPPGFTPRGSLTDFTSVEKNNSPVLHYIRRSSRVEDENNNNNNSGRIPQVDKNNQVTETVEDSSPVPQGPPSSSSSSSLRVRRNVSFKQRDDGYTKLGLDQNPSLSTISSTFATVYSSKESIPRPRPELRGTIRRQINPREYKASKRFIRRDQPSNDSVRPRSISSAELEESISVCNSSTLRTSKTFYSSASNKVPPSIAASVRSSNFPGLESVFKDLKQKQVVFDRTTAMRAMKERIMRGEKVTYEEIFAIKSLNLPVHQKHLGWRLPWSMDLYCEKGLVRIPTPCKPGGPNSFGTLDDLRMPFMENGMTEEHYGRRRYLLNLAGFKDDEISLYLEGKNRLVIRAVRERYQRSAQEKLSPAIVTETIVLPPDLPADNLRIVRKPSGTTIIEESWRF